MYYYYLYNHKFESDIKLFNIPQSDFTFSDPNVKIHSGFIDPIIFPKNSGAFNIHKEYTIVKVTYGVLHIKSGKEIIYSVNEGYSPESITPYIMGWGIAFILTQMGFTAFHCSALTFNNQGFFVSGVSGAGKSTTSLELIKNGCKYLCDDIATVDSYESMMIPPAFPVQKVCPDITSNLNENLLYAINNDRGKFAYLNTKDYCNTQQKLTVIFKLLLGDVAQVEVKEITGIQKFLRILECLFLDLQYAMTSIPEEEKFRCLKIAGNVKLFTITRPKDKSTLNEITDTILKIMNNQGE